MMTVCAMQFVNNNVKSVDKVKVYMSEALGTELIMIDENCQATKQSQFVSIIVNIHIRAL